MKNEKRVRPSFQEFVKTRGFSTVELLAVIGTISVLAALLVPSGMKLLRTSDRAQCVANLKTLHTALDQYAADHKGFYPAPMGNILPNGTEGSWTLALAHGDYLGKVDVAVNKKTPFLCPAAKRTYAQGMAKRTYGMNTLPFITQAVSPFKVAQPSQTVILADGSQSSAISERDAIFYFRSNSLERVDSRHDGLFQALFMDGHIEPLKAGDPQTKRYIDNILQ